MMTAPAGGYTMIVSGNGGGTGTVLAECYDADSIAGAASAGHLVNMSARADIGTGDNVLIGGFVIDAGPSASSATLLIRAMGPSLSMFGVSGNLAAPTMTLFDGSSKPVATNAMWTTAPTLATGATASTVRAGIEMARLSVMTQVGAFTPMPGGADAAMVATLPPGNYSVVVSGKPDSTGTPMTGIAILEIYLVR